MKYKKGKLTASLTLFSALPLLVFGLIVMVVTSGIIYRSLRDEVQDSLKILVHSSYQVYELSYPGDYIKNGDQILKGGNGLKGRFEIVDQIQKSSGADATLFWGDTRYLTTIRNEDGSRALGTKAEKAVAETVLNGGKEYFSDHVLVNGTKYFGYYMPVKDGNGSINGMLFVGKPRREAMRKINGNILTVCLFAITVMGITIPIAVHYSRQMIKAMGHTQKFLGEIAQGNLTAKIDSRILRRQDEIGEMGRFAVMLQNSIASLVGKDPLTGLHNRRSCDIVLQSLAEKNARENGVFCVVMGDIDYFKQVNDTYGHQAGDEVLKQIANIISGHMEHVGFVFRWGGEEFLMVYEDMDCSQAKVYLRQLQKKINNSGVAWNGKDIRFTMTFGLADFKEKQDIESLICLADDNLYKGKGRGRNCIICTSEKEKE